MPPCVVSLRVVLTSMILIVAVIAAAISFAPLYTASLSSATNSGDSFSGSISREIGQSVTANFNNMQSTVTTMVTAARLNAWSPSDLESMISWMGYAVALGADTVNIALDTNITWTASYVAPTGAVVVVVVGVGGSKTSRGCPSRRPSKPLLLVEVVVDVRDAAAAVAGCVADGAAMKLLGRLQMTRQ